MAQLFFTLSDTTKPQAGPVALHNSDRMFVIQFEEGTHSVCSAGCFITTIGRENAQANRMSSVGCFAIMPSSDRYDYF
ncbi:hypothetical protein VCRA2116O29_400029 [Vibrio crassostreae]|nr:hypothetical protein VCRA2116O29_400029 [Vibrio crassostreae]CAK3797562.1 hypothetical protein VCRA2123O74_360029 [Vibrio crassostreae]